MAERIRFGYQPPGRAYVQSEAAKEPPAQQRPRERAAADPAKETPQQSPERDRQQQQMRQQANVSHMAEATGQQRERVEQSRAARVFKAVDGAVPDRFHRAENIRKAEATPEGMGRRAAQMPASERDRLHQTERRMRTDEDAMKWAALGKEERARAQQAEAEALKRQQGRGRD